jgi:hypothetical protein
MIHIPLEAGSQVVVLGLESLDSRDEIPRQRLVLPGKRKEVLRVLKHRSDVWRSTVMS